jgi:carbon storage regulator
MLILSRKLGECIVIDGRIQVKIVRLDGEVVKVGIEAPVDVPVHRLEVYEEIQRNNHQAVTRQRAPLPRLPLPMTTRAQNNLSTVCNGAAIETAKPQVL